MPGHPSEENRKVFKRRDELIANTHLHLNNVQNELKQFQEEFEKAAKFDTGVNSSLYFDKKRAAEFIAAAKEIRKVLNGGFMKDGVIKDVALLQTLIQKTFKQ